MTYQLTVQFIGLAIHFNREDNPKIPLPYPHRIVIPHRGTPLFWDGKKISVHEPVILFDREIENLPPCLRQGQDGKIHLSGVTMRIEGGTSQSGIERKYRCLPRLKRVWKHMVLDEYAIVERRKPAVAYFDIDRGILDGFKHSRSAATQLTVELEEPQATLAVDCWNGDSHAIPLPLPTCITIQNTAKTVEPDDDVDFVLDFLIAENFPPPALPDLPYFMDEVRKCLGGPPGPPDLGPGCSNSQYP